MFPPQGLTPGSNRRHVGTLNQLSRASRIANQMCAHSVVKMTRCFVNLNNGFSEEWPSNSLLFNWGVDWLALVSPPEFAMSLLSPQAITRQIQ